MSSHALAFLTIAFCIATEAARELCFKYAATRPGRSFIAVPATWAGILFWGVELLAWTTVLAVLPLSIAFPLMALSYACIAIAAAFLFGEMVDTRRMLGIALVAGGVVCVGVSGL
ncbi:permease [Neorhizobium alkalisoli]|uniref:Undecaprenyl phosphate-alpha-L-ara4N flippase subunit ArnE n=1 Tax=Neorhizobium alkalisoli TaxID=528178 RepID=A0A561QAM7_9HYPH|nr:permease [Neorhizobium alkalisoli]TWF47400.1 undecaprenyl phosphate-alpha-L-ara4N flippase subunit ArnE [Neorhizobium alkalisoli]